MKKALILGCGYVGGEVAKRLNERGVETIGVTRNEARSAELEAMGVRSFLGRVDSEDWHEIADTGVDFVLNCVSSAGGGMDGYRDSYVGGNRSLSKWMDESGFAGRAVYTSSVSVYADTAGGWVGEEDARPDNERGKIVRESENHFFDGGRAAKRTVLRLGGIYGPGRTILARRIRGATEPLDGRGDYFLNLIRLEDIAGAILEIAFREEAVEGIFNVVDDCPVEKGELASWLAERMGCDFPGFSGVWTGAGPRRRDGPPANRKVSNAKLKSVTDWRPRYGSYREGFVDLLRKV